MRRIGLDPIRTARSIDSVPVEPRGRAAGACELQDRSANPPEPLHTALSDAEDRLAGDAPAADEERLCLLHQLFGAGTFRDRILDGFRRDVSRNIELVAEGIEARRARPLRDALHAIRSSAATAGASRLFHAAARLETAGQPTASGPPEAELRREFNAYCEAAESFGREAPPAAKAKLA